MTSRWLVQKGLLEHRWRRRLKIKIRYRKSHQFPTTRRKPACWASIAGLLKIRPRGYKSYHAQLNWARNFNCSQKLKYRQIKKCIALRLSDIVFIMLINVKMPTIVGILTFISRINFVLDWAEHGKSFITSRPAFRAFNLFSNPV